MVTPVAAAVVVVLAAMVVGGVGEAVGAAADPHALSASTTNPARAVGSGRTRVISFGYPYFLW